MDLVPLQRRLGLAAIVVAALALAVPSVAAADLKTFISTGTEQTFVVPADVTTIHAIAIGGRGGDGDTGGPGGYGAVVSADLPVTPGQTLYIEVGGNGKSGTEGGGGGFNGGGNGGEGAYTDGGGGGGATDIRTAPRAAGVSLYQRLLVAAGGGGSGGSKCGPNPDDIGFGGTAGAVPTAGGPSCGGGGNPGTSTEGGKGASGCGSGLDTNGGLGFGGPGMWDHNCGFPGGAGGGGGGGLYGGGGGGDSSAGGGGGAGFSGFGPGVTNTTIATDITGSPSVLLIYTATPSTGPNTTQTTSGSTPAPPASQAACKVPKLTGKTVKAAKRALRNGNCSVGKVNRRGRGANRVVGQSQQAGKSLDPGTAVSVTLGGGSHRHPRS